MYSRDKLFSALHCEIERILIKKIMLPLLGLSVVESPSAVSHATLSCIIVAVRSNDIEVTPMLSAQNSSAQERKGCYWCWGYIFMNSVS